MSQRLIQPGRSAAGPIGHTRGGTAVWSLGGGKKAGSDPDVVPGADDDAGDDSDDDDDDGDDSDDSDGDGSDDDDDDDDEKPEYTATEYDKIRKRMRAADQRAARLEAENRTLKAQKPVKAAPKKAGAPAADTAPVVDDTATREAEAKAEKAEQRARKLAIQVAFTSANTINWYDVEDAKSNIDFDEIDVDEDGTVDQKQLARALRALAKRKPHLVKPPKAQSGTDDDDDTDAQSGAGQGASKMNGRRKGKTTPDRAALASRFGVVNRL